MARAFATLVERRVIHWTLGYLAAAWAVLEALGFMAELYGWSQVLVRSAVVLLAAGLLAVVVLSWFHGSRGPQRVSRIEAALLAVIVASGAVGVAAFGPTGDDLADAGSAPEVSLAVLPPTDLTGDPAQEYFVAGMHEALISQLAQVTALRVISRRSTLRYRESQESLPQIAEELGVEAVIESAITRSGDSVGIRARLVRTSPRERLLWSETFHAGIQEVLTLHGQVARAIAREARVELTPDQQSRLAAGDVIDPQTYEAYLRGMHALGRGTPQDFERGLAYLHEAVDRDPADALAYAGLAMGYATLGHGPAPPPDTWTRAREAAHRAITLDPTLAEAHAALAKVAMYYEWDWEVAEREFRRANELNPSLAMNRYHYAWYLALAGRMDEAIAEHKVAKRLDPLTAQHTAWLGGLYVWDGRPQEGLEEALLALELDSLAIPTLFVLGDAYAELGRYDEAIATHQRLVELTPVGLWVLGRTYAAAGMEDEARRIRTELEANPMAWNAFGLIVVNTALGDFDQAFEWLEHEPNHAWLPWTSIAFWTEDLRRDPRFARFLQRLDLPSSGSALARR